MNNNLQMLNLCIEIEGLVSLIEIRGEYISSAAIAQLKSKCNELCLWANSLDFNVDTAEVASVEFEEKEDAVGPKDTDGCSNSVSEDVVESAAPSVVINDTVPVEFSLNDTYRFRQALFGNNDADMKEALHIISSMNSADDVKDYLYNDLCWDSDNETVKEFIDIVTRRF